MDEGEEDDIEFVEAGGDGAELLEFGEEVLDQMARLVQVLIIVARVFSVGFVGDDRHLAGPFQRQHDALVGVESLVGDHRVSLQLRQQNIGPLQIAGLSASEMKSGRVAERVHRPPRRVNFGAQTSFAASDSLLAAPFLRAPALCWWARTMVESIMAYSLSASLAR